MTCQATAERRFITTAIPYVNARPHLGFAMELVLADVLARYRRLRGDDVHFLTGTDENSLKNVRAAQDEGVSTEALVDRNAEAFRSLRASLDLSFDDFIRTSRDPRHRAGVEKLWNACASRGDIYKRAYRGLYCVGCEQFYTQAELVDGRCPEHGCIPEPVEEENYFFRLSNYQTELETLLSSGTLRVVPERYRNEVLAFVRSGLTDFSISRSSERAHGWGIPVPGDPSQVMYVWFDALGNYITALDFATEGELYAKYWLNSTQRLHVLGKGITRFHAVYWPAMLLSAGLPLPSVIAVHGYLTVGGKKIGKSLGNAIDPEILAQRYGVDVLRFFLCRHVRSGRDGDFTEERLVQARDSELADQLGNLLRRSVSMIERYRDGRVPPPGDPGPFADVAARLRPQFEAALEACKHDDALNAVWSLVELANKYAVERAPWTLAKRRSDPIAEASVSTTLYNLAESLRLASVYLASFMPSTTTEVRRQLGLEGAAPTEGWEDACRWGRLEPRTRVRGGRPLFSKDTR